METNTMNPPLLELPIIKEASSETIFTPANFRSIYYRVVKTKPDAKRQWGKMNIVQMLNHMKIATGSAIKIYELDDESNFLYRTVIKFIVLRILKRLPKSAKAPEGFKIEMNDTLDFDTEKEQVLDILKKAYRSPYESYTHPQFGKMSREEWGRLVYRHFDHHLRQFSS